MNAVEFAEYEAKRAEQDAYWDKRQKEAMVRLREKRAAEALLREGDTGTTADGYDWEVIDGQVVREDGAVRTPGQFAWALGRPTARAAKVEARRSGISEEDALEMLRERYMEARTA